MKWSARVWLILAVCLAAGPLRAEQYTFPRPLGLNTDEDASKLEDGHTSDAENVVTDDIAGILGRKGYVNFSTEASRNLWVFPHSSGNNYLITQSSGVLRATLGTSSFSVTIGTVATTELTEAASLGDKFYWVNVADGLKYWDTNTVYVASSNIKAGKIAVHKGRLWLGAVSGDLRTIYGSEYLNGGNFTLAIDPVDTDPVRIQVQGKLDEAITALFGSFADKLLWFKRTSFGGIYGARRSNFESRSFSETVGCSFSESIRDCDGRLRWLSSDKRIWEWDGNTFKEISDNRQSGSRIKTLMDDVVQGDLGSKSAAINTQSVWEQGVSSPTGNISASLDVGKIRVANQVLNDDTQAEFLAGNTTSGFYPSTSNFLVFDMAPNPSFEMGAGEASSSPFRWTTTLQNPDATISSFVRTNEQSVYPCADPTDGSYAMVHFRQQSLSPSIIVDLLNPDNSLLDRIITYAQDIGGLSACGVIDIQTFVGTTSITNLGKLGKLSIMTRLGTIADADNPFTSFTPISTATLTSQVIYITTTAFTIRRGISKQSDGSGTYTNLSIDGINQNSSSATFISSTFDFLASSPIYQMFTTSTTGNDLPPANVGFNLKTGTSPETLTNQQFINSGTTPTIRNERYAQYVATVSVHYSLAGSSNPLVASRVFIKSPKIPSISSGVYTTKTVDTGGNAVSWGRYQIIQNANGGTIAHQINSSTTTTFADDGWVNIQPDVTIGVPVRRYLASRIRMEASTHTQIPTITSIIYNWNEGGDPSQKVVSGYTQDRYWLGVGISSSLNNAILVYDKFDNWHKYTNIRAEAMTLYQSKLYFGNTDGIFETENGYLDNGQPIASYYKTKDMTFGTYNQRKIFDQLYLTATRSSNTLSTDYFIDGSTTSSSLASYTMNTQSARQNFRIPFPADNSLEQGKSISFKFSVTGSARWDLLNADLFYTIDSEPFPE